ncbi:MAG: DUF4199 domain-containing protein [Flavobacteriaceae bacterium]|nr:DUF4199 domain-containing protein [Flavobacteriaceae bacterium]
METNYKKKAASLGLILGVILALITASGYAIDYTILVNPWLGVGIFLAIIGFGIVGSAYAKKYNNGFASFKEAFTGFFITIAIGIAISTLANFILFGLIDTEAATQVSELVTEAQLDGMENWGAPQEAIEQAAEKLDGYNHYSFTNLIQGCFGYIVVMSIFGLIIALIMKRKDPNAA